MIELRRLRAAATLLAACSTPATKQTPIANTSPQAADHRPRLSFEKGCDQDTTRWQRVDERDEVALVTCIKPTQEEGVSEHRVYIVQRGPDHRGTQLEVGSYTPRGEWNESYSIAGIVRDPATQGATHVLIVNAYGALDEYPSMVMYVYEPPNEGFDGTTVLRGNTIDVDLAHDASSARIEVCSQSTDYSWDYSLACARQQGARVETHVIRASRR